MTPGGPDHLCRCRSVIIADPTPADLAHSAEGSQVGWTAQTASGLQNRRARPEPVEGSRVRADARPSGRVLPPLPNLRYESGPLTVP